MYLSVVLQMLPNWTVIWMWKCVFMIKTTWLDKNELFYDNASNLLVNCRAVVDRIEIVDGSTLQGDLPLLFHSSQSQYFHGIWASWVTPARWISHFYKLVRNYNTRLRSGFKYAFHWLCCSNIKPPCFLLSLRTSLIRIHVRWVWSLADYTFRLAHAKTKQYSTS